MLQKRCRRRCRKMEPFYTQVVWPRYRLRECRGNVGRGRMISPDLEAHRQGRDDRKVFDSRQIGSELLEDFAGINNERALLAFISRYGSIGYSAQGDPVKWGLRHAEVVSGLLTIVGMIEDIKIGRQPLDDSTSASVARSLSLAFRRCGLIGPQPPTYGKRAAPKLLSNGWLIGMTSNNAECFEFYPPDESNRDARLCKILWVRNWVGDPLHGAYVLLQHLLNPIIGRLRCRLVRDPAPPTTLSLDLTGRALIEVIYWRVASRIGGPFLPCQECGRFFPAQGKRHFCSKSCMNKNKCRRYRTSK
jgi:hypothetical protein